MSGQQLYIYQKNNRLPDSVIAASVSPSEKTPLVYPLTKQGTGDLRVYGNYEGAVDARYEVRVLDKLFESPHVSAPVFRGAGTGRIKDISAVGLTAQEIQVLCLSTGVNTEKATVEIEGLIFRSKTDGAAGNGIAITIDTSSLVFTQTIYSTLKDLRVGDTALSGQEWDFDTKVLAAGLIPSDAHRIAFGEDRLHIYRQYKKFEDGIYKYYFVMPIKYEVPAGARVYFVTGGRTITVTDGVTEETYENIITIADFWTAVRDSSTLIEPVNSSIDTSMSPSSPAVRELAVMTDSYFLPSYRADNSSIHAGELNSITVNANTKTELVKARCIDNAYVGAEIWQISGSSSGELGQARTGEYNEFGPAGFTIPQKFPADWGTVKEDWSHEVSYASRGVGITPPPICFSMRLGINAKPQTVKLTYRRKPAECTCPTTAFSDIYLGFEEKGGERGMAYTVEDLSFWTDAMAEAMREQYATADHYEGRTAIPTSEIPFTQFAREYMDIFKALARRLGSLPEDDQATLAGMVADYKALVRSLSIKVSKSIRYASRPEWPSVEEGFICYKGYTDPLTGSSNSIRIVAGNSGYLGEDEPEWTNEVGATIVDGEVTWTVQAWQSTTNNYPGRPESYQEGDRVSLETSQGYIVYEADTSGVISQTMPEFPTEVGQTVADGDVTWECIAVLVDVPNAITWDGTAWSFEDDEYFLISRISTASGIEMSYDTEAYLELAEEVLLYEKTHGVKKNSVSYGDVPYWPQDSEYYWEVKGNKAYLPAFTDTPYYSMVQSGSEYVNTKEFAFNISVPCGGSLLEGDSITVTIGGVLFERTYQVGDITYLPTIAAQALQMTGGIDGDDTYVFEVRGDERFPDYLLDRDNPQPYLQDGLSFEIEDGIVMFQVGDAFAFAIEGGHFQWRRDDGSWSVPLSISNETKLIERGISVSFDFGTAPSFEQNDSWEILAQQENKAANMLLPSRLSYKGTGNIVISFGEPVGIDCLVIDGHDLSGTIGFQASDDEGFGELLLDEEIDAVDLICFLPEETITAKHFRLVIVGEHQIGHVFLGSVMQLSLDADAVRPLKRYKMQRQEGKRPLGLHEYTSKGYTVEYSSFVRNADWEMLDEMIRYLKTRNDMELFFVPNVNYPASCIKGRIDIDNVEPGSDIDFNAPEANRIYNLSFSVVGAE